MRWIGPLGPGAWRWQRWQRLEDQRTVNWKWMRNDDEMWVEWWRDVSGLCQFMPVYGVNFVQKPRSRRWSKKKSVKSSEITINHLFFFVSWSIRTTSMQRFLFLIRMKRRDPCQNVAWFQVGELSDSTRRFLVDRYGYTNPSLIND